MKKAFTLVVLIVTPTMAFTQGTVVFINSSTGLVKQWTSSSDPTLTPVPVGGGYVQLIAAPRGTPLLHPLGAYYGGPGFLPAYSSLAGFLAANSGWVVPSDDWGVPQPPAQTYAAPGRFNGGTRYILGVPGGASADYVVIGWTGPYATYDDAYAADLADPNSSFLGMSAIATTQTGNCCINPSVPVLLSPTFQGITLAPAVIPEPATVLLAGLGAVLLLFRRHG
jgi:hypothetical protein